MFRSSWICSVPSCRHHEAGAIQYMFGRNKDDVPSLEDLSKMSGLAKLQSLSLNFLAFQRAWYSLKHLTRLRLSLRLLDDSRALIEALIPASFEILKIHTAALRPRSSRRGATTATPLFESQSHRAVAA
jgi:hypothetical protein